MTECTISQCTHSAIFLQNSFLQIKALLTQKQLLYPLKYHEKSFTAPRIKNAVEIPIFHFRRITYDWGCFDPKNRCTMQQGVNLGLVPTSDINFQFFDTYRRIYPFLLYLGAFWVWSFYGCVWLMFRLFGPTSR